MRLFCWESAPVPMSARTVSQKPCGAETVSFYIRNTSFLNSPLAYRPEPSRNRFWGCQLSATPATSTAVPDLHLFAVEVLPEPHKCLCARRNGRDFGLTPMAVGAIWEDRAQKCEIRGVFWSCQQRHEKQGAPFWVVLAGRLNLLGPNLVGVAAPAFDGYHRDFGFTPQHVGFAKQRRKLC